jgi:branched-chain amino acid transport system substrate-binding protein
MKKTGWICLAVILAIMGLVTPSIAAEPIKIGCVFAITGPASFLGEPGKNSALLVQDRLNAAGGINGTPVEIIIEDSKSEESQAVLATKKLIEKDNVVAIIGASVTGESLAMVPICESAKIPMISQGAAMKVVTPDEEYKRIIESPNAAREIPTVQRTWVFKTPQTDNSAVEAIYEYMQKKAITKVGILTVTTGFGATGRQELKRMAPKYGITISADETYGPKDTDMTAQLTRINSTDAQAIINWSVGPTQIVVTKNWKALAIAKPLFQSHGFGSKKNIELAGDAAEGVIAPLGYLVVFNKIAKDHPQYAVLSKYVPEYESRYKSEVSPFGGYAYDALNLCIEAITKVGTDKSKVRDYLENNIKNWPGVSGVFNMSPADHTGLNQSAFAIIQVVKGDWEFMK